MPNGAAVLVSGTGDNSFGAECAIECANLDDDSTVVAIANRLSARLERFDRIFQLQFDLNPLCSANGFTAFAANLYRELSAQLENIGAIGIGCAVLAAGVYEGRPLVHTTAEKRRDICGVNVVGKVELLHAILALNSKIGSVSQEQFTVVDVGGLHGVTSPGGRVLYSASKAFGLDLSLSLFHGGEVGRVVYLAPGPIDTCMLHRNHWETKEGGEPGFVEFVQLRHPALYDDVFRNCSREAFETVAHAFTRDPSQLISVFERYKARRTMQRDAPEGIIDPAGLGEWAARVVHTPSVYQSGVYKLTAPDGQLQVTWHDFSAFRRTI